jgi:hypothetical protein
MGYRNRALNMLSDAALWNNLPLTVQGNPFSPVPFVQDLMSRIKVWGGECKKFSKEMFSPFDYMRGKVPTRFLGYLSVVIIISRVCSKSRSNK